VSFMMPPAPSSLLFPYTTLFRSESLRRRRHSHRLLAANKRANQVRADNAQNRSDRRSDQSLERRAPNAHLEKDDGDRDKTGGCRSEEHTSELQSRGHLVCRLLLE